MTIFKDLNDATLKRHLFIYTLVSEQLNKKPGTVSFMVTLESLTKSPLFPDIQTIKLTLDQIEETFKKGFSFSMVTRQSVSSVADTNMKNPSHVLIGFSLLIETPEITQQKILQFNDELKQRANKHFFTLTNLSETHYLLSVAPHKGVKSIKFEKKSERVKILKYLAEQKNPIKLKKISTDL